MLGWLYRGFERSVRRSPRWLAPRAKHVPAWLMRRVTEAKLVHTLRYVWRRSPAQRERWRQAGIRFVDLRSSKVLRRVPMMRPEDLAERGEEYFCVPREELVHVLTTTGTKGVPKRIYLTADDFERHMRMLGTYLLQLPDATRAMAVFNVDLPTLSAGSVVRAGFERAGIFGILSFTGRPVAHQIQLIRDYDITLVCTMPAYLHRMTVEADEDLRQLGVRFIVIGGQAWSEAFRRLIEDAWGAKALDAYGSMELGCSISAECVRQNGLHIAQPDFWVEIIDPDTDEPCDDGVEGELVVTTLSRRGMPFVRYRTRDMASLLPDAERCACGLQTRRMSRVRGRIDDMLIIGGDANIYADEWDRALLTIPGVTDYQVIVDKDGAMDALTVRVENSDTGNGLKERVMDAILGIRNVEIAMTLTKTAVVAKIEVVPRGALLEGRSKTRRVVDRRDTPTAGRRTT